MPNDVDRKLDEWIKQRAEIDPKVPAAWLARGFGAPDDHPNDYAHFRSGYYMGFSAAANQWTSIEDGLPEKDGGYLICDAEGFMLVSYFQTKQARFLVLDDNLATDPIAWMPLPAPYAPEGETK